LYYKNAQKTRSNKVDGAAKAFFQSETVLFCLNAPAGPARRKHYRHELDVGRSPGETRGVAQGSRASTVALRPPRESDSSNVRGSKGSCGGRREGARSAVGKHRCTRSEGLRSCLQDSSRGTSAYLDGRHLFHDSPGLAHETRSQL